MTHDAAVALAKQDNAICQTFGKALGYPRYCDDQKNFPGSTEADGVCVGEHVAETIAAEAAGRIAELEKRFAGYTQLREAVERGLGCVCEQCCEDIAMEVEELKKDRELLRTFLAAALHFVPHPESMSGYDDQNAPDEVKALIAKAESLTAARELAGK